jgi:hypothetical protein
MKMLDNGSAKIVNGIDLEAVGARVEAISRDPAQAAVAFHVSTEWKGQTRSETTVESYWIAEQEVRRSFKIAADEPIELLGTIPPPTRRSC